MVLIQRIVVKRDSDVFVALSDIHIEILSEATGMMYRNWAWLRVRPNQKARILDRMRR